MIMMRPLRKGPDRPDVRSPRARLPGEHEALPAPTAVSR